MRKSLIEINRPETKRFDEYGQLADHLNEVKDASEWTIVRAEDTLFDGESGANTFEAMGGDEFSCVSVSFDEGATQIPLRYTALTSMKSWRNTSWRKLKSSGRNMLKSICRLLWRMKQAPTRWLR